MIAFTFAVPVALLAAADATPPTAPPAFEPAATVRALAHDEGRPTALKQLLALPAKQRGFALTADDAAIPHALDALLTDASAEIGFRLAAIQALVYLAGGATPEVRESTAATLAQRLPHLGTPEETAIAREAAIGLRGLKALPLLAAASASDDPEIRATVAATAAAPADLCARLKDPWPVVRAAAARGLALGDATGSACVAGALSDTDATVRAAAVRAAGEARVAEALPALRALAGDSAGPVPLRVDALYALGRLGELEPARMVLNTHLAKGGIVPLAEGAVSALAQSDAPGDRALVRQALSSEAGPVVLLAAQALARAGDAESLSSIQAARPRVDARHREALDAAIEQLKALTAPPGESPSAPVDSNLNNHDPADDDPE